MTDLDRTKEFFDSLGVRYEIDTTMFKDYILLEISAGSCEAVEGYGGFVTDFKFAKDTEQFVIMGVWE